MWYGVAGWRSQVWWMGAIREQVWEGGIGGLAVLTNAPLARLPALSRPLSHCLSHSPAPPPHRYMATTPAQTRTIPTTLVSVSFSPKYLPGAGPTQRIERRGEGAPLSQAAVRVADATAGEQRGVAGRGGRAGAPHADHRHCRGPDAAPDGVSQCQRPMPVRTPGSARGCHGARAAGTEQTRLCAEQRMGARGGMPSRKRWAGACLRVLTNIVRVHAYSAKNARVGFGFLNL
jgi:hypothetical protein